RQRETGLPHPLQHVGVVSKYIGAGARRPFADLRCFPAHASCLLGAFAPDPARMLDRLAREPRRLLGGLACSAGGLFGCVAGDTGGLLRRLAGCTVCSFTGPRDRFCVLPSRLSLVALVLISVASVGSVHGRVSQSCRNFRVDLCNTPPGLRLVPPI